MFDPVPDELYLSQYASNPLLRMLHWWRFLQWKCRIQNLLQTL
jgi:hypothetical protein